MDAPPTGDGDHVLAVGSSAAVLLDRHGSAVGEVVLPSAPVSPPAFGDFTNDGVPDVLLVTSRAVEGVAVRENTQATAMAAVWVVGLVVVLSVWFGAAASTWEERRRSAGGPPTVAQRWTVKRSTD